LILGRFDGSWLIWVDSGWTLSTLIDFEWISSQKEREYDFTVLAVVGFRTKSVAIESIVVSFGRPSLRRGGKSASSASAPLLLSVLLNTSVTSHRQPTFPNRFLNRARGGDANIHMTRLLLVCAQKLSSEKVW
jgi:hypothetical protein